jgi:hypothetical protein
MIDPWAAMVAHPRPWQCASQPRKSRATCATESTAFTHQTADLGSGPHGQRRPRRDVVDLLGPRAPPHNPDPGNATSAWPTPAPLADRPSPDPAPSPAYAEAHRPRTTPLAAHRVASHHHHQPLLPARRELDNPGIVSLRPNASGGTTARPPRPQPRCPRTALRPPQ